MKSLTIAAPAKLNLTLDILGLRPDGYHELDMLMQAVSLCDDITLCQGTGEAWRLSCADPEGRPISGVPQDERNLAWRAAAAFFRATGLEDGGLSIHMIKRIPAQAGMAGGSADAAALLRGLNQLNGSPLTTEALCDLGASLGSDIPFCVLGGTARVRGRGERVEPVALSGVQHYVICKPPFGISTPKLFALSDRQPVTERPQLSALLASLRAGELWQAGRLLCNVLESVAALEHPELFALRQKLLEAGACGARMTGSGSAVFGLFPGEKEAKLALSQLKSEKFESFYAHSV